MRVPACDVVAGEHAAMRLAAGVHDRLRTAETVDRLGDEALRPALARRLDLLDPVGAGALGLAQDARVGVSQRLVGEERAGLRHRAPGEIDRGRCRPIGAEEIGDRRDSGVGALDQRIPGAGVVDRGREHVGEPHRAVIAQQHGPGVERAGDAGGKQTSARHHVEAEAAIVRDRGVGGRRPLAADHLGLALAHVVHDDRHIAARPVEVRLNDLEREGGCDSGVEGVAPLLQGRHADGGRDPVGRGDNAESALDLGPRGERIGIDVLHSGPVRMGAQLNTCRRAGKGPAGPAGTPTNITTRATRGKGLR